MLFEHLYGGAAGDDGLEVIPAADHTTTVSINQLFKRDAHLFFNSDGVVDMSTDAEEFGARVVLTAETIEPTGSAPHDCRANRDGFDVRHRGWAPIKTSISWEGRLQSGTTGFSLKTLNQTGLLAADIGTGTTMDNYVEVVT